MRRLGYTIIGFAVVTAVITCKKAYNPAVSNADSNILVVEGMINSGGDSTIIKLTRSDKINAAHVNNATANAELKATVTVEGDNNTSYPLKETADGLYVSAGLILDAWANMKKNTESLGSIFDAQPSTAQGNIQCISDRTRPAIGYVSVGTVQSKRIFIDATDLRGFHALPKDLCSNTSRVIFADLPNSKCFPTPGHLIVDLIYNSNVPVGVTETNDYCADCTLRGTLKTPSFWK